MPGILNIVKHIKRVLVCWLCVHSCMAMADPVSAVPRFTFAGNMDFVVTGGTLRTQPNTGNSCAVTNSDTSTLSGIPVGATIVAAYLYWAGSGPTADLDVTFQGLPLTASRSFSDNYSLPGISLDFFSGYTAGHISKTGEKTPITT